MNRATLAVFLFLSTMLTTQAHSLSQERGLACFAKVLKSEELPYAPMGYWLVREVIEVMPAGASAYEVTLQKELPWQASPPRQGQTFKVRCDPASPGDLRLMRGTRQE